MQHDCRSHDPMEGFYSPEDLVDPGGTVSRKEGRFGALRMLRATERRKDLLFLSRYS